MMKDKLSQEFEMTDFGELKHFLRMWLKRDIEKNNKKNKSATISRKNVTKI
jgi:hypothetical protein